MAGQKPELVALYFEKSDAVAQASTFTAIPPAGLPDTTDVAEYVMPTAGYILGCAIQANPTSGDTVIVEPSIATVGQASPTCTATNAAKAANQLLAAGGGVAFTAGQTVGLMYKTTTGGTYTANDLFGTVWVAFIAEANMVQT